MNAFRFIFPFIFLFHTSYGNQVDSTISCHVNDLPFNQFAEYIYNLSRVRLFYSITDVKELRVTINDDSISVKSAVEIAIKGTDLKISEWNGNLVISKYVLLGSQLPDYKILGVVDSIASKPTNLTETELRYLTGRKPDVTETVLIGKAINGKKASKAKIKVSILDKESGEPVIGAIMFVEETKTGSVSDKNGTCTIVLNSGKFNVRFECLGFETKKYLFDIHSDGDFKVEFEKSVIPIQEVVLVGDRKTNITTRDPGMEKLSPKTIKEIPMMLGERDILKVSEMLPGIVSAGEGTSGINVRGGSSDQNMFYINKIPIYNTFHVFGFFPAFNADIIKDFSIYKGYIPAQYGGRLSSIFNIITKQGNRKHFNARGGINPVTANISVEGPIKRDTLTVLFSARSSYSDWILSRINDPTIRESNSNFYDISSSIHYDINAKNQVSLFYYQSYDNFSLANLSNYSYSNKGASLNWRHTINPSLRGEFSIVGSNYSFITINKEEPAKAYKHNYMIGHYEVREDLSWILNEKNTIDGGLSLTYYNLHRGDINPYGNESLRNKVALGEENGSENSFYLDDNLTIYNNLSLVLGLRYSLYFPFGPKDVYKYSQDAPRDNRYVIDTIHFGKYKPIKYYSSPEIRFSITYKTDANGSIKLAYNETQQNLFMLTNTITVAPNTQWKLSDYHLRPSRSNQLSFGLFRNFPSNNLEISVELYGKKTANFTEFKDGADFISSPNTETSVLQGTQYGYGIECMVKRTNRKIEGWLTYTYSRSLIRVDGKNTWDRINEGRFYPANYDIPHVMNLVANYHLSRRLTMSTIITYQTGKPVTYPMSVYYVNNTRYIDYSLRNEYRIPDYFRVDGSITLEGNLKKEKFFHSSFMVSVYNATGRKNPYSVFFRVEDEKIKGYKYSIIGVPFVTVTWLIKLGNYASD